MTDPTLGTWRKVSPGIYSRPLDEPDLYYTTNAKVWERTGQTASSITVYVGISLTLSTTDDRSAVQLRIEDSLRYAWKQVRYHCPILASRVVLDPETKIWNRVYQVGNEKEVIDKWIDKTFSVSQGTQTAEEFVESDPPVPLPALFVFPVATPEGSKLEPIKYNIIFRSGHDVIDGMAAYAFMDNLLGYTSEAFMFEENIPDVTFGSEHRNLPPPFRAVLGISTSKVFTDLELRAVRDKRSKDRENALSVPAKQGTSMPGKTRFSTFSFSVNKSQTIIQACKSRRTTITQTIHAAIGLAVRDLQPRGDVQKQGKYVSYAIMSLWKYCQEPYNGPKYDMMTCHVNSTSLMVVDVIIPPSATASKRQCPTEFGRVLKQVQRFYVLEALPKDMLEAALCFAARTPSYPTASSSIPSSSQSASVSLSSRGITDHYVKHRYGPFEVLDPWCMGTELSNALGVALNTWKGEMCLRAGYNVVFHEQRDADMFLESVQRIVLEGLEIV